MREMKDSGVAWLGDIDSRFDIKAIGNLFTIKKDIIGREPDQVLSITQRGIKIKDTTSNEGQNAASYAHYQIVNVGDFAMNHMDLLTGWVDISRYEGVTSPDYRVFTLTDNTQIPEYFLRVFQMYYSNRVFYAFGQGAANLGRWRLPRENFVKIAIPCPPVELQRKIVDEIAAKVSKVDALIANQQAQIEKLKQYKQSLITEVVTKGLVPNAPMKDIALEAAEDYSGYVSKNIFDDDKKQKQYTFIVLQYIHGRCCQEFLEILHLMRLGFADCAYARWRSMFELCCTASFILMQGETIAKQYFEHSQEEGKDYAWTAGAVNREGKEIIIKSFHALMDHSGVEQAWQKQYKMACLIVHGTPQGTFKRLCLKDEKQMIVVGQSDYGITTPAEHSAISLQWITSMFLSIFPNLDAIVHIKVLQNWVEEVRKRYFATEQECFTDC